MGMKAAFVLLLCLYGLCTAQTELSAETRLKKKLFENYDKSIRPMYDPNSVMYVNVDFLLKQIQELDEKNQVLTSFGWIVMDWKDEFLMWDPAEYNNATRLVLPASDIWLPEIAMFNSVNQGNDISMDVKFRIKVYNDGTVVFTPGYKWQTECKVDLTTFPFDYQSCNVSFVNWVYNEESLIFKSIGIDLSAYEDNDEWEMMSADAGDFIWQPTQNSETRVPEVYFRVNLKRRSIYYNLNVLAPSFIVALLSCLVFMVPSDAGEKISLSITVLLSFTVLLLIMSDVTPRSGLVMPRITIFIVLFMAETATSLMVTIILLNFYHHPGNEPVCSCYRNFVFGPLAKIVCLKRTVEQEVVISNKVSPVDPEGSLSQMIRESNIKEEDLDKVKAKHDLTDDVIVYLRFLMRKEKENEVVEKYKTEWRMMARILDRFCFCAFITLTVLAIIAFLCSVIIR